MRLPQTARTSPSTSSSAASDRSCCRRATGCGSRPNVVEPGAAAAALQAANNLNRIIVDDATEQPEPRPHRVRARRAPVECVEHAARRRHVTGLVGVLTYTWAGNAASGNAYRVRPIGALSGVVNFVAANAAARRAADAGGTLRVAARQPAQLLQHLRHRRCTGGVGGAATDCRGAGNAGRVRPPVAQDRGQPGRHVDADVIGMMEIENDGYGLDQRIQHLVDELNARAGAGTYAFVDPDATAGNQSSAPTRSRSG